MKAEAESEARASDAANWPGDRTDVPQRGGSHFLVLYGLLGATASILVLALYAEPDPRGFGTHEQLGLPPCQMMEWTGVPCPGCGVTTSVTLAAQGDFFAAFLVQPFGVLTVLALPLLSVWAIWSHRRGADLYRTIEERKGRWIKSALLLIGLAWIYKIAIS